MSVDLPLPLVPSSATHVAVGDVKRYLVQHVDGTVPGDHVLESQASQRCRPSVLRDAERFHPVPRRQSAFPTRCRAPARRNA
jgi:hypothetical protein